MPLPTKAEQRAEETRELPEFKNFALPGVRDQVTELLALIGRVEGIFSTYSKHDISHIDRMLKMLDWLIPETTAQKMTPADWLLIVLSIYLHDLGMLVTAEEFSKRKENPAFLEWFEGLDKTNEGREYLARTRRMTDEEKERFFYQEFVRMGHAARIREWIAGQHSRKWGSEITSAAESIRDLLSPLPVRFREYLGDVCESHHADNLDNRERFPLYAPCGNEDDEIVNVQYAAILLRTTDLLHVTKDRTPSIMIQHVRLSDPKGITEWDKQLGTFSVRPGKRKLDLDNPESAVIRLGANFREERPLFALQEYIAYAHAQVHQSNRWADKSQEDSDAQDYSFPWHAVQGDVRLEGVPPMPLKFEMDRGRLLDLLVGHTIYNDATVAVRELLQNAIDAVRFQHHKALREAESKGGEKPNIGAVRVLWCSAERKLTVEDRGIGMDSDVIKNHLMKVGASYYGTPQFEAEHSDFSPISRFGIGILTCFMVSDDIEIVTCSKSKGHRIRMTSVHADYLLRELPSGDPLLDGVEPNGTRVTLSVRETIDLSERTVEEIVRHWIILPECRVEFNEDDEPVKRIGFDSPEEALRFFHRRELRSDDREDRWRTWTEFINKKRGEKAEGKNAALPRYDLTLAVYSGGVLERSFASRQEKNLPAVCIEGIRVSDTLPWYKEDISALLAVRGDRRFRTTVSRSGLEVDENFHRVGRICSDLLFEHVKDEVTRIAARDGRPLSQASSASRFLVRRLLGSTTQDQAEEYLRNSYHQLPALVIERAESNGEHPVASPRTLISVADLSSEQHFWTIESRLVDSLGIISRDLGREFGVNEFLEALAPEHKNFKYSPLLPDAHVFKDDLIKSHAPSLVEFSRQNQQTSIKWTREVDDRSLTIDRSEILSNEDLEKFHKEYSIEQDRSISRSISHEVQIYVAKILGDDDNVRIVRSRVGAVLGANTEHHKFWEALCGLWNHLRRLGADKEMLCITYLMGFSLHAFITRKGRFGVAEYALRMWRQFAGELEEMMKNVDGFDSVAVPVDLNQHITPRVVFDVSRYWRNWFE